MATADIGIIGLAVMGQNLVLNMTDNGFTVAVFNRSTEKVDAFLSGSALSSSTKGTSVIACYSIQELVSQLSPPRRIMLMVQAGIAVDETINALLPFLQSGDIIIDGGNSHFLDSNRRFHSLQKQGFYFIGAGVSGGEEGARFGPSIMPGGDFAAWPHVQNLFQSICAKVNNQPCCEWIGPEGSGHFVKMVHNGIEYGDMQLIAEAYDLLHRGLELSNDELHKIFNEWNTGVLDSFLIEITATIFSKNDIDGLPLLDKIRDSAGQKGTGKWTVSTALDLGTPLTLIAESVFSRSLSSKKSARELAAKHYSLANTSTLNADKTLLIQAIHNALYTAKIISYTQGFMLLRDASSEYQWPLDLGAIALSWRGGCIIRSRFLDNIYQAFSKNPSLDNLLLDDFFTSAIKDSIDGLRLSIKTAIDCGIPSPAMSAALAFFDGYISAILPANLIQAQRDYFGAHSYERLDHVEGKFFHTHWHKEEKREQKEK